MQGRIKPRFEDLASATRERPKIVDLPRVILEPNDHTQVLADFKAMSDDIRTRQYGAAATRASAEQIAQATGVPVEVALQAMAQTHSNRAVQEAGVAQALSAEESRRRHELLMEDRLFGQTALKFRHFQQLNTVAQQVMAALPAPPDASGDTTMAPPSPEAQAALEVSGAAASAAGSPDTAASQAGTQAPQASQAAESQSTSAGIQAPTLQDVAAAAQSCACRELRCGPGLWGGGPAARRAAVAVAVDAARWQRRWRWPPCRG